MAPNLALGPRRPKRSKQGTEWARAVRRLGAPVGMGGKRNCLCLRGTWGTPKPRYHEETKPVERLPGATFFFYRSVSSLISTRRFRHEGAVGRHGAPDALQSAVPDRRSFPRDPAALCHSSFRIRLAAGTKSRRSGAIQGVPMTVP